MLSLKQLLTYATKRPLIRNSQKSTPIIYRNIVPSRSISCRIPANFLVSPQRSIIQSQFFSCTAVNKHKEITPLKEGEGFKINIITREGDNHTIQANEGDSIMDITMAHDIDLECACEGSLACSTCHVIVDPKYYEKLEEPTDEENDMLDLAFGLTETSRLGCQIVMKPELDGITVTIPSATRNVRLEGSKLS
ncbi:8403_t:CDS:2 [Ambispora gerdemannii]|uniref:8403_t:CDS:1 n=1 Tax=Ambispora gerdemannii TaxID=144530 RepID=A0A9N8ZFM2_9GLOM|nr:8403_t:CDS:2 [Ambispora gerdemannii]